MIGARKQAGEGETDLAALEYLLPEEWAYSRIPLIRRSAKTASTASRRQRTKKTFISRHKRIVIVFIAVVLFSTVVKIGIDIFCRSNNDGVCLVLKAISDALDGVISLLHVLLPLVLVGMLVLAISWFLLSRRD